MMLLDVQRPTTETRDADRTGQARRRLVAVGLVIASAGWWLQGSPFGAPPSTPAGHGDVDVPAERTTAAERELLTLSTAAGFAVADARTGEFIRGFDGGVAAPDGLAIWRSEPSGPDTVVRSHDVASGATVDERLVTGRMDLRLVGWDGRTLVLGPAGDGDASVYAPVPRTDTRLVVSRPDGERVYDLVGNFEPEALSRDGRSLFLISYVPPESPERYQVRRLDLTTGTVEEVFTPDEELQQEMGGTARVQAWGPEGRRLYTLYTLGEGDATRAFVHVLDLDGLWAHCIDLPEDLRVADEYAIGMGVSPDGRDLYVADGASGRVLRIDARVLEVVGSASLPLPGAGVGTVAVAPDGGGLLVGVADRLWVLEPRRLTVTRDVDLPNRVVAAQPRRDGMMLVILGDRRVVPLDPSTGRQEELFRVSGRAAVDGVPGGPAIRVGSKDGAPVECAC